MEMRMNKIKVVSLGGKEITANYLLTVGDLFLAYGHSQRSEAAALENDNEQSQRSDSEASQASSSMTA
eukprot:1775326-Karenia_brevis.AAC.1